MDEKSGRAFLLFLLGDAAIRDFDIIFLGHGRSFSPELKQLFLPHTPFLALKLKNTGSEFESKKRGADARVSCSKQPVQGGRISRMARIATLFASLFLIGGAHAGDLTSLQPGEYEVQMKLELPHVEDMGVKKTEKICVTDSGTHGIVVLSENNPLVRCPASNIHRSADELTFDLICEGHNQAVAWAKFQLGADRFSGAFDMKMGGKNMTMTERQTGQRIGPCKDQPPS